MDRGRTNEQRSETRRWRWLRTWATAAGLRVVVVGGFVGAIGGIGFGVTPLKAAAIALEKLDLNGDGVVSMSDVIIELPFLLRQGSSPLVPTPVTAPDVNGDGRVSIADVVAIVGSIGSSLDTATAPPPTLTATPTASFTPTPTWTATVTRTPTRTPTPAPTATSTGTRRPPTSTVTPPAPPATVLPATVLPPTETPTAPPIVAPRTRDKLKQPFASTSIWNMPIGSGAAYVPAGIHDWTAYGVFLEENIVINRPAAPLTPVYDNGDAWSGGSRCAPQGGQLFAAPLPSEYIIPGATSGNTPNYASAILTPDGNSYLQGQPLTHCTSGGPWTTFVQNATVSLYGDGILGAQGGSHLSSVGGAIRLGEWHARAINHALKTVLDPSNYSSSNGGYRWPAVSADSGMGDYSGANPAVKMGTLLALRPDFDTNQLQTEPGRIVARAFMSYGCYIVDSGWAPAYLPVEQGPDGNADDEFQREFGFPMKDSNANSAWSRDWRTIVTSAYVVDNNGPASIGGGGVPRAPLAPPIGN